jgi:hydrogenase maturation protein HypF
VQHHHAHIASVLAEHGLDEKVIGVSLDGTGLGDDGKIWGSEFLVCDLQDFERISHLEYMPMPGGDKATHEPWRMAVSYLYSVYGWKIMDLKLPFLKKIDPEILSMVIQSIEKKINCPLTCGTGRLFDAVSAMLGLCTVSKFHAEAPMRLEAAIRHDGKSDRGPGSMGRDSNCGIYPYSGTDVIGVEPMIRKIAEDLQSGMDPGVISTRFHNTLAGMILETAVRIKEKRGISKVCLSGGTFQNKYLSTRVESLLRDAGFEVFVPLQVPTNDGGIALGQLAVATRRRSMGLI